LLWKNSVTPVGTVGSNDDLALWQQQPLETVYRLNVGGPKVNKENDTLWRTWLPDGPFLDGAAGRSVVNNTSGPIVYIGYTYNVAPDIVYKTQRRAGHCHSGPLSEGPTGREPVEHGLLHRLRGEGTEQW
jgi:hypothetical protein